MYLPIFVIIIMGVFALIGLIFSVMTWMVISELLSDHIYEPSARCRD